MASANIIVGYQLENLDQFDDYILPHFLNNCLSIADRIFVFDEKNSDSVLLSMIGIGDPATLKSDISLAYQDVIKGAIKLYNEAGEKNKRHEDNFYPPIKMQSIVDYDTEYVFLPNPQNPNRDKEEDILRASPRYRIIGLYENNDTASKIFVSLAMDHISPRLESVTSRLEEAVNDIANASKQLSDKLKDANVILSKS